MKQIEAKNMIKNMRSFYILEFSKFMSERKFSSQLYIYI